MVINSGYGAYQSQQAQYAYNGITSDTKTAQTLASPATETRTQERAQGAIESDTQKRVQAREQIQASQSNNQSVASESQRIGASINMYA
jgi:hypothetical protein